MREEGRKTQRNEAESEGRTRNREKESKGARERARGEWLSDSHATALDRHNRAPRKLGGVPRKYEQTGATLTLRRDIHQTDDAAMRPAPHQREFAEVFVQVTKTLPSACARARISSSPGLPANRRPR